MPTRDVTVNVIGVDKGTSAMLKKLQLDADAAGTGIGDAVEKGSTRAGNALSKFGNDASGYLGPLGLAIAAIGDKFTETSSKGEKFASTVSEVGKVALLGGIAGLAAFGAKAVELGNQLEDSQASLSAAVKASGQSLSDFQPQIDDADQKLEALGFTNTDVATALTKSDISTQNLTQSLGFVSIAADLARAKHIDLASAMDTVDRAATGNLRGLKSLGIDLPITATSALKLAQANAAVATAQQNVNDILAKVPDAANAASAAHGIYEAAVEKLTTAQGKLSDQTGASQQIISALSDRLNGQAGAYVDTFTGKMTVLTTQVKDMGAQVGEYLIPKIQSLISWIEQNKGTIEDLAKAFGVVLGAAIADFVGNKVGQFIDGVGKMVASIGSLAGKMTSTAATVEAEDGAIIEANEAAGASFTAMLGPIGAVSLALIALKGPITNAVNGLSNKVFGTTSSSSQFQQKYNAAYGGVENDPTKLKQLNSATSQAAKAFGFSVQENGVLGPSASQVNGFLGNSGLRSTGLPLTAPTTTPNTGPSATAGSLAAQAAAAKDASAALAANTEQAKEAATAQSALQAAVDKVTSSTKSLISDALDKATTSLAAAKSAFADFASSTSASVTQNFSFSDAESAGATTGQSFIQSLQSEADKTTVFTDRVQELISAGLNQSALTQVLAAGTDAGTDIADQLLAGGVTAINQANDLTTAVQNQATALGTSAADQFYGAGVSQAQSIVDGITDFSKSKTVAAQLKTASKSIADSLKASITIDLKILAKGGTVPKLASGGIVNSPTLALIGEAGPEAVIPLSNGPGSVGTGGGDTYIFNVTANGADPQAIVNALKTYTQRSGTLKAAGIT